MEIFSSYEVRVDHGIPNNITTRIADSDSLLISFLYKVKELISDLKLRNQSEKPLVVGLNVECDFLAPPYSPRHDLLQLCFDDTHCVIIQLHRLDISTIRGYLNPFFSVDQDIVFVGVGIKSKLAKLETTYELQFSKNVIELGSLADRVYRKVKYYDSKLEELASEIVGLEIKIPNSCESSPTAWFEKDLTSEQIEYATLVAYASYAVGNKLLAGAENN